MRKREGGGCGEDARTCGCTGSGDRSESCGETENAEERKRERAESKSEDTNHGRVTDLRRLTGRSRSSAAADAFALESLERLRVHETKNDV